MIKVEDGVRLHGLRPEIILAIMIADQVFDGYGSDAIVTSAIEGKHSRGSLHYAGSAVDLRRWHLDDPVEAVKELQERLGDDYDVILEDTHIHVEWQAKEPYE